MRRLLLCATLMVFGAGPGRAEDDGVPLVLTVTPSGVEDHGPDRLMRRARDLDFAFRSICVGCGTSAARPIAPGQAFAPLQTLAASRKAAPQPPDAAVVP